MVTIDAVPKIPMPHGLVSGRLRHRVWVCFLSVWLAILFLAGPLLAQESKLDRAYQSQQRKLKRQGNSVKKVRILIQMSAIDLEIVSYRVRKRLYTEADTILERYAATVDRAKQVLENSGRDPQRRPGGFKHLEISLRKQLRQLADLKDLYSFDRQEVINRAIACAKAVKQRMIASLFGSGNTVRQGGGSTGSAPAGKINDCSPCRSR